MHKTGGVLIMDVYSSVYLEIIMLVFFSHTTRKIAVKDWHLVVFVLIVNSFNAIVIFVYLIQEGATIGYIATLVPNRERLSSIDGVSNLLHNNINIIIELGWGWELAWGL